MNTPLHIRPLARDDYRAVGRIFFYAIHEGTKGIYSDQQRLAWGGETIELDRWKARLDHLNGFIAEINHEPVGFFTIDREGYLDLAFVLPSVARMGVGQALLKNVEQWAKDNGATQLTTDASLVAWPFFLKNGWHVTNEEHVERNGVTLTRYKMHKRVC